MDDELSPGYVFLILMCVLLVVIIGVALLIVYKPAAGKKDNMIDKIDEITGNVTPNEIVIKDINLTQPSNPWSVGVAVDGIDGKCNVYTFLSNDKYSPAIITYASIQSCNNGCPVNSNICSCSNPTTGQTCVDIDQLFAIKKQRVCLTPPQTGFQTSNTCTTLSGKQVPPGTIETFFDICNPTDGNAVKETTSANVSYCTGDLSLIGFNLDTGTIGTNIFASAVCLSTPRYSNENGIYTNLYPLKQNTCSMNEYYQSVPSQLFRIVKYSWVGDKFVADQNGPYAKIIHRPTGYFVAPILNGETVDVSKGLQLAKPTKDTSGVIWYFMNSLTSGAGDRKSPPQIMYIPDPSKLPPISSYVDLWNFATQSYTIQPELNSNGVPVNDGNGTPTAKLFYTVPIVAKTSSQKKEVEIGNAITSMYLSYSILPTIVKNPTGYEY